jgi:hypothetical protein
MSETVRKALEAFTSDMEQALLLPENVAKRPQWTGMDNEDLLLLMVKQEDKLLAAIRSDDPTEVSRRAVNVANYAMMIGDNARRAYIRSRAGGGVDRKED